MLETKGSDIIVVAGSFDAVDEYKAWVWAWVTPCLLCPSLMQVRKQHQTSIYVSLGGVCLFLVGRQVVSGVVLEDGLNNVV